MATGKMVERSFTVRDFKISIAEGSETVGWNCGRDLEWRPSGSDIRRGEQRNLVEILTSEQNL